MVAERNEVAVWMDRLAIQELAVRFCDATTRGDWAAFEACWAVDAVWQETAPLEAKIVGRDAIMERIPPSLDGVEFFVQMCHGVTIEELTADRARARTTIQGVARSRGHSCVNYGIYYDDLVKSDGVWRYARRLLQNLYVDTSPLAGSPAIARAAIP
jgi:hypothetical protein